jgi:quinol monooxygenase YgiN
LLQGHDNATRFVVIEIWDSVEAHQASVKNIPSEAVAEVMVLLDGMPVGEYYHERNRLSSNFYPGLV